MRTANITRKTNETNISIELNIDGTGKSEINSKIGFLNHMLTAFSKHGLFNLKAKIDGDLEIDQHHTVEDTGIVLGQAFKEALGDKKGINRAGYFVYPMDDALAVVAVDISGRPVCKFDAQFQKEKCGDFETDLVKEFFNGFSMSLQCNVHVKMPYGDNDHHKIEAIFKAFGKAMKMACQIDERIKDELPSTKGLL